MDPGAEFEFAGTGRFEVRRRIGAGGMGIVYEAFDREHNRPVALKTLRHADPKALFRFKKEYRALQDIEHPNLVSLGELIEDAGAWFFTMELVHGVDFVHYVRGDSKDQRLPPDGEARLRAALRQLAQALFALHHAGKVHRDIKPSNILVAADGRVVLLDFGLITETTDVRESTEANVVGTAPYMAPEQASAARIEPAADWYAVGVLLYVSLTGRLPFRGTSYDILIAKQRHAPPPPRAIWPEVPVDLDELCADLLRFDPSSRPDGSEVLSRIGADARDEPAIESTLSASTFTQVAPFLGRKNELELLQEAFQHSQRKGAPVTVFVHGEAGVGKTELIRHFVDRLAEERADTVVLSGRCYERESVPFKALDGVVDALSGYLRRIPEADAAPLVPRNASLLTRVFPVLARVEVIAGASRLQRGASDPRELRSRAFTALRELITLLGERRALVLVIDDFQWSDADSRLLLRELLRPPDAPRFLLLVSARGTASASENADGLPESTPPVEWDLPGEVQHVHVGVLEPAIAHRLARVLLKRVDRADKVSAAAIATEARGHPAYIYEIVQYAAIEGPERTRRPRLDEAIWTRASKLAPETRQVLELVCVAVAPLPRHVIAGAARIDALELARRISILRVAQFVRAAGLRDTDTIEPYHNWVRDAVLAHLPPETRTSHHAQLANALRSAGLAAQRPELLVRHLEGADEIREAAEYAEESARRAGRALAFDRAANLYRTALHLGDYQGENLRRLRVDLGDALANAGHSAEAAEAYASAAAGANPGMRLECQRKAAQQFLISGHIERGLDTLRDVLSDTNVSIASTPRRALASLLWQRFKLRVRGLRWREKHESQIAPEILNQLDIMGVAATGLGVVDTVRGMDFQSRALLLALETGERSRVAAGLCYEACFVATKGVGSLDRARALLDEARAAAEPTEDAYLAGWITATEALLFYFGGRFGEAAELFAGAHKLWREHTIGSVWEVNQGRVFLLHSLRLMGAFAHLRELHEESVRDAVQRGDRYLETTVRRADAILCLVAGEPERTVEELAMATWVAPEHTFHLQHWYELEARVQLALYQGTARPAIERLSPEFDRLERSLLLRIQTVRTAAFWLRARLLLAASRSVDHSAQPDQDRVRVAARLARRLAKEKVGYAVAWAHLVHAAVAAIRDEPQKAEHEVRAAAKIADDHGLRHIAAAAWWRLGDLLGGAEAPTLYALAERAMRREGIVDPERMVEVFAPGFPPPKTEPGGRS